MSEAQDHGAIEIFGMDHFYGSLWVIKDGDKYFWRLDDYNGGEWKPITKRLYNALIDYNKRAASQDKTPPAA